MAGALTARPLVVEFVGLPGVGKSHVTRLVADRLAATGLPVRSAALRVNHDLGPARRVLYKLSLCAAEIVRRPRRALTTFRALATSGQQNGFDVVRLSYNWFFLLGLVRDARRRPVVELLDEGIVQQLWSVGFGGDERLIRDRSATLLDPSTKAVAIPDVVVLVEAPLDVVASRLTTRGSRDGRIDRLEPAEHHAALERGAVVLRELLEDDVRGGTEPLVRRVRNGEPVELAADIDTLAQELAALTA